MPHTPSPFSSTDDWNILPGDDGYFGPSAAAVDQDPQSLTVDIVMSDRVEIFENLERNPKTPLHLLSSGLIPSSPGIYKLDCLIWWLSAGECWIERNWSYIGEGKDVAARLHDYEKASRSVKKNGVAAHGNHEQKIAARLLAMLESGQEDEGGGPLSIRLFLSWVESASVTVDQHVAEFDLAEPLQRRFVERALMVQTPGASNEA